MRFGEAILISIMLTSISYAGEGKWAPPSFCYGVGMISCGKYLAALEKHGPSEGIEHNGETTYSESALYSSWIFGYITAQEQIFVSRTGRAAPPPVDMEGITEWMKQYSKNHPTQFLMSAANAYCIHIGIALNSKGRPFKEIAP